MGRPGRGGEPDRQLGHPWMIRVPIPDMLACSVQLNLYVPGLLGAVMVADSPFCRSAVLKLEPSSEVTLWATESSLVTLIVSPAFTVSGLPKLKFLMVIVAEAAPPPPPPVVVDEGPPDEPLLEEQAATASAASNAAAPSRRSLIMLRYT